jgi:protein-tyrosine phosphatase
VNHRIPVDRPRIPRLVSMPPPFRVLYVCTGNICRSPLAERLARHELERRLGPQAGLIEVTSAGTHGLTGHQMYAEAATVLAGAGGDPAGFAARLMEADHVIRADLVLTATREHRAAAVRLDPRASGRTFTIREFGRLGAEVDPSVLPLADPLARLRAAVEEAAAHRGLVGPESPDDDDVPDPYGGPAQGYEEAGRLIGAATAATVDLLAAAVAQNAPLPRAADA